MPYVPPSTVRSLDEEQPQFNCPTAIFNSPVSSDSLEEPSSDGLLDEVMLRKNVLKTLISVTCRPTMGVP